jgi:hypothetical protein
MNIIDNKDIKSNFKRILFQEFEIYLSRFLFQILDDNGFHNCLFELLRLVVFLFVANCYLIGFYIDFYVIFIHLVSSIIFISFLKKWLNLVFQLRNINKVFPPHTKIRKYLCKHLSVTNRLYYACLLKYNCVIEKII